MMRKSLIAALFVLSGTTFAYADTTATGLKVFDAQGNMVGPLVSRQNQDGVQLTVNGTVIFAGVTRVSTNNGSQFSASQWQWANTGFVVYPAPNCSGDPVITYAMAPVRPTMLVRTGADVTAYIAKDAYSTSMAVASMRQTDGQCVSFTHPLDGWTPESTYPLTQHYPEPLTIHY
jgi:hypothetical protein